MENLNHSCEETLKSLRRIFKAFFDLPNKTEEQFDAMDEAAKIIRLTCSHISSYKENQQRNYVAQHNGNKEEDNMPARSTETIEELQDQAQSLIQEVDALTDTINSATKDRQSITKKLRAIQGKIVTIQLREKQGE